MGLGMKHLNREDIRSQCVRSVGLDPNAYEIESVEFIASGLRRIASSLCPCTSSELVRNLCESASPILKDSLDDFEQTTRHVLESLIGNSDLVEAREVETTLEVHRRGRILYLRPPSFIRRHNDSVFLVGIPPSNAGIFPPELEKRIEYFSHVRRLSPYSGEDLPAILRSIGLTELSVENWDRRNMIPETERPTDYIDKVRSKLRDNPGSLEGLEMLASQMHVRFYSRRWEPLSRQTGSFVARRPQAFGNNLWCYVEVRNGVPVRMVDFPALSKNSLGRDEAWRLQMAIDADRGTPQEFTVVESNELYKQVKFYSPIPSWAQRRWDSIAEPAGSDGCLFSYRFLATDLPQEITFMTEKLWLAEKT